MKRVLFIIVCIFWSTGFIMAQQTQTTPVAPIETGFREDVLKDISDIQSKFISLAGAIPQDKFPWRPAEGIRSVDEVVLHVSSANFLLPRYIGVDPPEAYSKEITGISDKAKATDVMQESFDHIRESISKLSDSELDRKVKFFDGDRTVRSVIITMNNHMHEHLGQLIAYARMNGITPPWSAEGQ